MIYGLINSSLINGTEGPPPLLPEARTVFPQGLRPTVFGESRAAGILRTSAQSAVFDTVFMPPAAMQELPPPQQNWTVQAQGANTTAFGRPAALSTVTQQASGWSTAARLGTPRVRSIQPATGWQTANFGAANAVARVIAQGFRTTTFGSDRSVVGRVATSIRPTARFGPRTMARLSRAVSAHQAVGFVSIATFGTPAAQSMFRARHHAPTVRFGRALVRRAVVC